MGKMSPVGSEKSSHPNALNLERGSQVGLDTLRGSYINPSRGLSSEDIDTLLPHVRLRNTTGRGWILKAPSLIPCRGSYKVPLSIIRSQVRGSTFLSPSLVLGL